MKLEFSQMDCSICIHKDICKHKETVQQFYEEHNTVSTQTQDGCYPFIIVDYKCKHFDSGVKVSTSLWSQWEPQSEVTPYGDFVYTTGEKSNEN